jgi:predicted glycosyltransferase involved in capsule biosynthesis
VRLTLVVPFRAPSGHWRDARRLARLLAAPPPEIEIVVADDTLDAAARRRTARLVAARPNARHVVCLEHGAQPFSVGRLRDLGAEAARDGAVMFHDVDFLAPRATYARLAAFAAETLAREGRGAFFCAPVFFMTLAGTAAFCAAPEAVERRLLRAPERPPWTLANRLVLGSSAIALSRETLLSVGGHDPGFVGHGAEDFDLLHRLSERYGQGPRPSDYCEDFGVWDTSRGFRAYFARYGRAPLRAGVVLAHQWHPWRSGDRRYYATRADNFTRLRESLRAAEMR